MATAIAQQRKILPPDEGAQRIAARTRRFQRSFTGSADAYFGGTGIALLDPAYRAALSAKDRAEMDAFLLGAMG